MQIKRILMAYDFSESSNIALDHAIGLAKTLGAKLELLHVIPYDDVRQLTELVPHLDEVEDHIRSNVEKEFQKVLGGYAGSAAIETHIQVGKPDHQIVDFAEGKINGTTYDLLVLGTQGHTGISHFLLGSVAERVLRHAKVPVLVSRGSASAAIKKIIVPIDLSDASASALKMAKDWAARFHATLSIVHVLGEYYYLPLYIQGDVEAYGGLVGDYEKKEKDAIEAWVAKTHGPQAPAVAYLSGADPAHSIIEHGKSESADLIVLGTHGRTGLEHLLLGSVAEKVARFAACSVLTVH